MAIIIIVLFCFYYYGKQECDYVTTVWRYMLRDIFHTVTDNLTISFVQVALHLVDRKEQDLLQGMYGVFLLQGSVLFQFARIKINLCLVIQGEKRILTTKCTRINSVILIYH